MKTSWTKGITDKGLADEIKGNFISALLTRKRLIELLEEKSNSYDRKAMNADGYDCPNWAYKMADIQGYKRALSEVVSLLE